MQQEELVCVAREMAESEGGIAHGEVLGVESLDVLLRSVDGAAPQHGSISFQASSRSSSFTAFQA